MTGAATEVLIARAHVQEAWTPVVLLSVVVHTALLAGILFMPAADFSDDALKTVMTISLGGAPGPRAGGMSQIGGRTVQELAPADAAPARAAAPPAAKAPEMTIPSTRALRRQESATAAVAAREPAGRATTRGEEIQQGSARADTGARGQGFGLSGGGGGGGNSIETDVGDFCCPEYLETVIQMINRHWNSRQGVIAQTTVKATIQRNGTLTDIQLERPSGFPPLDTASQRALLVTARVLPLPAQFTNPTLTIHFVFKAER